MSETNTQQRLLREAAHLMGQAELARRLKVSQSQLEGWIGGQAKMPERKLLALAKVLDTWASPPS